MTDSLESELKNEPIGPCCKDLWEAIEGQQERIFELEKQNAELVKERDELNKQCGEFQEGFFEYMGLCDHLQIEVDNLKKKIINITTPDVSKKSGCGL